jgi:hypothetical protein
MWFKQGLISTHIYFSFKKIVLKLNPSGIKKIQVFEINYEILNNFDSVAHHHPMTHDSRTLNCFKWIS